MSDEELVEGIIHMTLKLPGGNIRYTRVGFKEWCIEMVWVAKAMRKHGLGSKLMEAFLKRAKEEEIRKVTLVASPAYKTPLEVLINFYSKFGFKSTDHKNGEEMMCLN